MTRLFVFALVGVLAACAGDAESDAFDPTPWVTTVDSTGDTTIIRITGEVPPTHVRSLVAELRVGAEEGDETVTFGEVGTVLGTPGGDCSCTTRKPWRSGCSIRPAPSCARSDERVADPASTTISMASWPSPMIDFSSGTRVARG